jgi:hypothetical protein
MASTTLVREFFRRVSTQLQDLDAQAGQFYRFKQSMLVDATNDGQRVLAKYLPSSCSRVDVIKLVPGTKQSIELITAARIKPSDGSTAVDMHGNRLISLPIRNMGANGLTPGRAIRPGSRAVLDAISPNWHTEVGTAVREVIYDPQTPKYFWVYPGVGTTDVWLDIPWLPDPIAIPQGAAVDTYKFDGVSTVLLSIDDKNVDDLMNYVIARARLMDGEDSSLVEAGIHTQMFVSSINTQAVAAGLPNPKLQSLPMPQQGA